MKKGLSILLLIILFYNSIGFIFNFQFILYSWRFSINKLIHSEAETNKLTVFKFKRIEYHTQRNEFINNGISYDVVKTSEEGDDILVYCYADHIETQLKNYFHANLLENLNLNGDMQKGLPRAFNHFFSEYVFEVHDYGVPIFDKSLLSEAILPHRNNALISLCDIEVKTPPPRISAA